MQNRVLLLGHRGTRHNQAAPENTIAAFDLALASGCDGFEFDVRRTADGQAVVCHDARSSKLEIAKTSAGKLRLPLLREILARYQRTAFLNIELKVPGLEACIVNLLQEFSPVRGCVVSSFLPEVLTKLHGTKSAPTLGLICETESQLRLWRHLPVEHVIAHQKLARETLIAEIRAAGRKSMLWTVNLPVRMRRFAGWGADGMISDNPKQLALTLARNREP